MNPQSAPPPRQEIRPGDSRPTVAIVGATGAVGIAELLLVGPGFAKGGRTTGRQRASAADAALAS